MSGIRITPQAFAQVTALLAEDKLSIRAIAKRVGMNRETVGLIAQGKITSRPARDGEIQSPDKSKPAVICPTCHRKVWLPCVFCSLGGPH